MFLAVASVRSASTLSARSIGHSPLSEATAKNIRRIVELWSDLRARYAKDGPFLLGEWSIADAFYTPVATRFRSYGVKLSDYGDTGVAGEYGNALLATPEFKAWEEAALKEA